MFKRGDLIRPKEKTVSSNSNYVYDVEILKVTRVAGWYIECEVIKKNNKGKVKFRPDKMDFLHVNYVTTIYNYDYKRFELVNKSSNTSIWF